MMDPIVFNEIGEADINLANTVHVHSFKYRQILFKFIKYKMFLPCQRVALN